jgi:hypothetical protein
LRAKRDAVKSIARLCCHVQFVHPLGAALALGAPASAQPAHPADAAATVPPLTYRSAFSGYKRLSEPPAADWKAANQNVERIGGWRAYAREANAAASAPAPAASAAETIGVPKAPAPAHRH